MNSADGVYDHSKGRPIVGETNEQEIRYDYIGPFATVQDSLISRALNAVTMPGDRLQEIVRPNLPQIQLLPPQMGYRTRALGIKDIMNVNEDFSPNPVRVDTYGSAGAQGTARNAQGQGFW